MSLREMTLQCRVDALEEAVEALAGTVRSHLPAASGMVDSVLSCTENAAKHVEKTIAQTVAADRVTRAAWSGDTVLNNQDLADLMCIYVPLLRMYDTEHRFFKKISSGGPYSYTDDPHELDLSSIPRNAYMSLSHTTGLPKFDSTRLTLHLANRGAFGWRVSGISGTESYQGEWVSYGVEYDGTTAPLFEREFIGAMRDVFRQLGASEAMLDPNFELNGVNGVVHALTLNHHTWRQEGKLLGEPIDGRGVVLAPTSPTKELGIEGTDLRITLWKDNPDTELEIHLQRPHHEGFRLIVHRNSQTLSLRKYGSDGRQLRPSDLSILDRMRLKLLIQFVVEILSEKRTDLLFRDALGIAIGWG